MRPGAGRGRRDDRAPYSPLFADRIIDWVGLSNPSAGGRYTLIRPPKHVQEFTQQSQLFRTETTIRLPRRQGDLLPRWIIRVVVQRYLPFRRLGQRTLAAGKRPAS